MSVSRMPFSLFSSVNKLKFLIMNCVTFVQENHTQHNRGILQNYEKKSHNKTIQ